jgi:ferredoxin-type protein NapG
MGRRRSRRDLLTSWRSLFSPPSPQLRGAPPAPPDRQRLLRPPGALQPDAAFLERCSGCGECVPACPIGAIFMDEHDDGALYPAIQPSRRPCSLCDGLPCIPACPDQALVDPGGGAAVRIGIAKVDPRLCVTFKGERCEICYKVCPFPDRAIMMIGTRPLVQSAACTGCGLCEFACPLTPKAITIVPERRLVPGLRVPEEEYRAG